MRERPKARALLSIGVVVLLGMAAIAGPSDASHVTTELRAAGSRAVDDGPPGSNGTIKVHDGTTEGEPIVANEPYVGCDLHLHGFNFDRSAGGSWRIVAWPPTGDPSTVRWSGTWDTSAETGDWRTGLLTASSADMVDGRAHFKVFVDQTGAPGGEKAKVFWVACQSLPVIGAVTERDPSEPSARGGLPTPTIAGEVAPPIGNVTLPGAVVGVDTLPRLGPATLPNTSTAGPSDQLALLLAFLTGVALYIVRYRVWRSEVPGPSASMTEPYGRDLLRLGALVLLLGVAFVTLLIEQTQALPVPGVGRTLLPGS